ncbi:MBL fold metallo-hydrolase [Chloroflexota bacterium]
MDDVYEIAENIYAIDNCLYSIPGLSSVYLINEEKKALIDIGPTTSVNAVLDGIKKVGIRPGDVDYIIPTHIHLDHAGGTGELVKSMPKAQVIVHYRGAWHIANPEKLIKGAVEAHGYEFVKRRDGFPVPIEEKRVTPVHDGDELRLSESQLLKFIDAPGHAPHSLCIHESRGNGVFTSDSAGLYMPEYDVLVRSSPQPGFDAVQFVDTLKRLMEMNPSRIYFAHRGASSRVKEIAELAIKKLQIWSDMTTEAIRENKIDGLAERLVAEHCVELEPVRETRKDMYQFLSEVSIPTSAAGMVMYHLKKNEAEMEKRRSIEGN